MHLILSLADFSQNNIGTLNSWFVTKSIGTGATYSGPTIITKGASFSATVTLADNYEVGNAGITFTMGGIALTNYIISDKIITFSIDAVTGDIIIKVPTRNISTGNESITSYSTIYPVGGYLGTIMSNTSIGSNGSLDENSSYCTWSYYLPTSGKLYATNILISQNYSAIYVDGTRYRTTENNMPTIESPIVVSSGTIYCTSINSCYAPPLYFSGDKEKTFTETLIPSSNGTLIENTSCTGSSLQTLSSYTTYQFTSPVKGIVYIDTSITSYCAVQVSPEDGKGIRGRLADNTLPNSIATALTVDKDSIVYVTLNSSTNPDFTLHFGIES